MKSYFWDHYIHPLKELHYFFSYPIINLIIARNKSSAPVVSKDVIVIVECWFQSNSYHALWKNYLEKKGFKIYLLTFTDMNESFENTAKKLHSKIQKLEIENFTLVGISTGAIVCLEYLNSYDTWGRIKRFISVAGPLHGTKAGWLISFTRKGRDIVPESKYIQKLSSKPVDVGKMVTLSALHDEFVPLKSSIWKGVPSHVIKVYGHNFFHLDHKETYDLIAELSRQST